MISIIPHIVFVWQALFIHPKYLPLEVYSNPSLPFQGSLRLIDLNIF